MFNNIWNALSNSVWPFTVVVFNLWAIGKVGGFFISIIIRVIADSYHEMHPLISSDTCTTVLYPDNN